MPTPVYTTDTSIEAERLQLDLLRQMTPQQRLEKSCALSKQLRDMAFAAIRRRHPNDSEDEIRLRFIEATYGKVIGDDVRRCLQERKS